MANTRRRFAQGLLVRLAMTFFALAGSITLALWAWPRLSPPPLERFSRAAARLSVRPTDGRLSGWPHLPTKGATRSAGASTPPAMLRLRGIAGEALLSSHDPHERAVAYLLASDTMAALDEFRRAAGQSNKADFWNDYAVAELVRSDEIDDPTLAIDAVAACDHALAIDGTHAAAHFNRGLSLARLGLLIAAADEWKKAATDDPGSSWAAEALQRAHDVPPNTLDAWTRALPDIGQLDPKQLNTLVRAYPQQARAYGEGICMTEWADAVLAGDAARTDQRLTLARSIGDRLRAFSGEMLLRDAVAAADNAMLKGTSRALATAYTVYRDGRIAHSKQDGVKAEVEMREAEALFASTGSPMKWVSRYFIGSALYVQTRTTESEAILDNLAAQSFESRGYLALAAQIGWERGLCALVRGSFTDAVDVFTNSRALFERLGETEFSAIMSAFTASVFESSGASDKAWRARNHAFSTPSFLRDHTRIAGSLTIAGRNAARSRQRSRAITLFGLAIDAALRGTNPQLTSIIYARRAIAEIETGDSSAAARDRGEAHRWAGTIADEKMRLQADADCAFADGMAARSNSPQRALEHFRTALGFYDRANYHFEMPAIYLECARVERATGRVADGRGDIAKGLAILETERSRLKDIDLRATLFASSDDLFATGVELALASADERSAFQLSDAQRARGLLDRFALGSYAASNAVAVPLSVEDIQRALADDSAIVEYCVLTDRIVAFVVRHDSLSVRLIGDVTEVATKTSMLRELRPSSNDIIPAASSAFNTLLRPLTGDLRGVRRVVFVPAGESTDVPFGAAYDVARRQFLIENTLVAQAPSASFAISASLRARSLASGSMLAIGASIFDMDRYPNTPPLPYAEQEAISAASCYRRSSTTLLGLDATRARILRDIALARSVHFGGHAIVSTIGDQDAALLVAPAQGERSEIRASELARLDMRQTSMVVLAACRTSRALGTSVGNENLALAFLAAGAASVIATTADLDDEVSFRMTVPLHRLLAAGRSPDDALREVLEGEIHDVTAHLRTPTNWAAIRLLGGSADFVRSQ